MSRLLPLACLPLAMLLGWFVRVEFGAPGGVVDESAAAHLRRVELALLEGETPLADTHLDPPDGTGHREPPFVDAAIAGLAQQLGVGEGRSFGQADEERLEAIGAQWGPVLGALGVLASALLALALTRGAWSGFAALSAGVFFALWPAAIDVGVSGRLDLAALQATTTIFCLAILAQTFTAKDAFDWAQGGLCGGLFLALALVVGPAALGVLPVVLAGHWILVQREEGERRHAARRAGLLLALTTAVITTLAAGQVSGPSPGARWVQGVSSLAFACGAPFLIAGALVPGRRSSLARVARGAGALVALLLVPYAALDLAPRLGALPSPVALPSWPALLAGAGAAYAAVLLLRASSEDALRRLMAIGALVLVPLGLFLPALAGPGLGLGVVVLALVVVGLAERSRVAAAASVALALVGLLIARPTVAFDQADADALRCLRAVPGSAWSSSRSPAHGSCLAPWTLGHRLAYLGRRAPTAPGNGQGRRRAAQALVATTEADLARAAGELRASHVLTGSLVAREWPAIEALVGPIAFAETAIGRLARQAPGPDSPWIEVLRIGEPADPVLVVLVSRASVSSQEGQPTMRAH